MRNKRGDTNWVLVSLLVAIAVGALLIVGFTIGIDKLNPFLPRNNIDNIKTVCSVACSTNNQYDFCSVERNVKDGVNDAFKDTCFNLADLADTGEKYVGKNYGIAACPSITCP